MVQWAKYLLHKPSKLNLDPYSSHRAGPSSTSIGIPANCCEEMACGDKIILEAYRLNSLVYTVISERGHVPNNEEGKSRQL